jgi:GTPase
MKSGFVAIVGRANVGKSTIINALVGRKVSIITPKPQTTRHLIQGVVNKDDAQIVFVDTPGFHKPHGKLGDIMNQKVKSSLKDIDAIILIVDASRPFHPSDEHLLNLLPNSEKLIIVFNKIDLTNINLIIELKDIYRKRFNNSLIIETSAIKKFNLDDIITQVIKLLPEGPRYFPEGMISNYPETFVIAEIIREKAMIYTLQEMPHVIAVVIDEIKVHENFKEVHATLIVEKSSQKAILIGKEGRFIKKITIAAEKELYRQDKIKYDLRLFVRVEEKWRNKWLRLKEFGLQ